MPYAIDSVTISSEAPSTESAAVAALAFHQCVNCCKSAIAKWCWMWWTCCGVVVMDVGAVVVFGVEGREK